MAMQMSKRRRGHGDSLLKKCALHSTFYRLAPALATISRRLRADSKNGIFWVTLTLLFDGIFRE
jgi:hypothetical protein